MTPAARLEQPLLYTSASPFASKLKPRIMSGDKLPHSSCQMYQPGKVIETQLQSLVHDKNAVLIFIPDLNSRTSSETHIPPYMSAIRDINALGFEVIILANSTPDEMQLWAEKMKKLGQEGQMSFIATGGDAPREMGLAVAKQGLEDHDYIFQRSVIILRKGVVHFVKVEDDAASVNETAFSKVFFFLLPRPAF